MQQIATTLVTWQHVKAECDVLDQMASQTVLKACEIGDMLRELRLQMSSESFREQCSLKLNRDPSWSSKLIVLSFRRDAVLKALAEGEANDSIRSAYEYVKSLPPPESEQAERERWPREKRGPEKGSGGRKPALSVVHEHEPEPSAPIAPDEQLTPDEQAHIDALYRDLEERIRASDERRAVAAERIKENRHPDNVDRKRERADQLALDVLQHLRSACDEIDTRIDGLKGMFQRKHLAEIQFLCIRVSTLIEAMT